ncbi:MAG TPA: BamA/TamA family outer membrane protein [Dinghuibacter sp.]|uniref:BamA/TamA family outer membrane protein n=1 Tax=Dinghuibacter sp. TaxID=2024697 RepID=UPI002D02400A|nr:BamA/TamA family outer membrane protein [Dinghuibacter sp.]HTJ13744.1 BamA/TamA family outer membrane protein [Dinghuibacter sp.]
MASRLQWLCLLALCFGQYGCYRASHYQYDKPFVFKNNIEVTADVSPDEKKDLERNLALQLDDSLQPNVRDYVFLIHITQTPAVYDTSYANNSLATMRYYMFNQGFFSPEQGYTYRIDTVRAKSKHHRKIRVTTNFFVQAGPRTLLDSIVYDIRDSTLQHLTDSSHPATLLVHGDPFNQDKLQGEVNRLIDVYKNNGYYAITQDAFQVQLDTANPLLINPAIDPLERIHLFSEQKRQQKNPTTDLYLTLAPNLDSNLIKKYFIRQVFIYPDFETTRDNRKTPLTGLYLDSINLRYHELRFKPGFLIRNNFLQPGALYRQDDYNKTLNTLNFLGVWQVPIIQAREVRDVASVQKVADSTRKVTIADSSQAAHTFVEDSIRAARAAVADSTRKAAKLRGDSAQPAHEDNETLLAGGVSPDYKAFAAHRRDSIGLLDFYYLLTPAKKQSFNAGAELNYSNNSATLTNNPVATGNLFGANADVSITNRNLGKEAIAMTNGVNGGVEVNPAYGWGIASVDVGYTNTITIPRFVTPLKSVNHIRPLAAQTIFNTSATYVERVGYFDLNMLSFKYGYQWKTKPNVVWTYNPVDVEYTYLYNTTDVFNKALDSIPNLRFAYTNALIMAQNGAVFWTFSNHRHPNRTSNLRAAIETSGLLAGIAKKSSNGELFGKLSEYIRPTVEYRHEIKYRNNNSWDFRLFSGVGIPLGGDSTLPFFKQFVAGGPNSMRAWAFRNLGPGSTHLARYQNNNYFFDRFGDIQFEGNIEYRYNIAEIVPNSMYLKGAVFTDIGNVWDFKKQPSAPGSTPAYDSATLDISHFYQELAVGAGVGFRLDFNYFVLRFDFGFRFKKPDEPLHDGWQWPDINLAHVFGRGQDNKEWRYNNYNFSFGIGYSF